jgi:hypothetical protein
MLTFAAFNWSISLRMELLYRCMSDTYVIIIIIIIIMIPIINIIIMSSIISIPE